MEKELNKLIIKLVNKMVENKIDYREIAEKCNMTLSGVWYILNGYKYPSISTFLKLAKALNFEVKIL